MHTTGDFPEDGRGGDGGGLARRSILQGLAGAALLGASCSRVMAAPPGINTDSDPLAGWQGLPNAAHYSDPRVRALAYAILAPNVQNLQPWMVRLVGDDSLLVFADLSRRLPVSDPPDRQLTVSFGTFTELMCVGASVDGYRLEIKPFPNGAGTAMLDTRPIVAIRFVRDATVQPDPLVEHVLTRSTNRLPFDPTVRVTAEQIDKLRAQAIRSGLLQGTADPAFAKRIRDIARKAFLLEMSTAGVRRELVNLTRIGKAELSSYRWGPALLGPAVEAAIADGSMTRASLDDVTSARYRAGVESYLGAVDTGQAYFWIATANNKRESMFEAGREWARLHLGVTSIGLKLQPHSQALHDYPEIAELKTQLHDLLGVSPPARIQMLGRVGAAAVAPHSPREAISWRLLA
ncbi:hypothetical protein [Rhizobium tropici]|nr:hypothetical protein [Rhizobium tropici]